jgi:hypothetical protein
MAINKLRKQPECLNCHYPLRPIDNFCPICGQKNASYRIGFGQLVQEFLSNALSFDTRLFRSIMPFLFGPGYLPKAFVEGKRTRYVHPLRIYFFISFLFFFLLGVLERPDQVEWAIETGELTDSIMALPDTGLNRESAYLFGVSYSLPNQKYIDRWAVAEGATPDRLLDSLYASEKNFINRRLARQYIKMADTSRYMFINAIFKNLPITIFFLLPVFALLLMALYWRKKHYYIEHLIVSLHLHAFLFFIASLVLVAFHFDFPATIGVFLQLFFLVYAFLMFKRFYELSIFRTLVEGMVVVYVYFIVILFFIIFEVLISALTF